MSDLGGLGQIFSSIGPAIGGLAGDIGNVGSELATGASNLFSGSGLEGALGGLFGGGGATAPGTLGAGAATLSDPASSAMAQIGQGIGQGASGVGQTASALMAAPGDPMAIATGTVPDLSGAIPGITNTIGAGFGGGTGISATTGGMAIDPTTGGLTPDPGGAGISLAGGASPLTAAQGGSTVLTQATGGGSNFLQSLLKNPKLLGEGGLLAAELINANRTPAGEGAIKDLAAAQGKFAKNQGELAMAEQSGILPSGATQLFQGMLTANEAAVRAKYAQMGMTGSTAELQDLQAVRDQTMAQMFQTGQQMAQQGWTNVNQATGYQSQLLDEILATETAQGTQLGQALAAFAGAAAK